MGLVGVFGGAGVVGVRVGIDGGVRRRRRMGRVDCFVFLGSRARQRCNVAVILMLLQRCASPGAGQRCRLLVHARVVAYAQAAGATPTAGATSTTSAATTASSSRSATSAAASTSATTAAESSGVVRRRRRRRRVVLLLAFVMLLVFERLFVLVGLVAFISRRRPSSPS